MKFVVVLDPAISTTTTGTENSEYGLFVWYWKVC